MEERSQTLRIALAQIAPEWLDRDATLDKVLARIDEAARQSCDLIVFGEALVPGYPFWLDLTHGSKFNSSLQKEFHSIYADQAVCIEEGHLESIRAAAASGGIAVYLGTIERPHDRGGHSLYCSLVYVDPEGEIASVQRKLMPTWEERLAWSVGDGHGLRVHRMGRFNVGGLNCWENWMPLARAALYAQGENLHVAVWPGSERNTSEITRFIAQESRSFVVSVSGVMRASAIPDWIPEADQMRRAASSEWLADGGSCLAAPDGSWVVEPFTESEQLRVAEIDHARVREERHNFDPSGHYARPDVLQLHVDRRRQSVLSLDDD